MTNFYPVNSQVVNETPAAQGVSGAIDSTLGDVIMTSSGTVDVGVLGFVDSQLDDIDSSSSISVKVYGSADASLDDIASTSNATLSVSVSLDATLDDVSSSFTTVLTSSGVVDNTLDDVSSESNATLTVSVYGSVDDVLNDVSSSSIGGIGNFVSGTIDSTLDDASSDSNLELKVSGIIDGTFGEVTSESTGALPVTGSINSTLDDVVSPSNALIKVSCIIDRSFDNVVSISDALVKVIGSIDDAIDDVSSESIATTSIAGSIDRTFDDVVSDSSINILQSATGTIDAVLDDVLSSSTGTISAETILDTDPTSTGYNSYVTRDEADELISELEPFIDTTDWSALTSVQKENVILKATDDSNSFCYVGVATNPVGGNNMMWPRTGTAYANGVSIGSSEIPSFMKEYIAQRCTEILEFGPMSENGVTVPDKVKRQKVGSLSQEFFSPGEMTANTLTLRDFSSFGSIQPYVCRSENVIFLQRA